MLTDENGVFDPAAFLADLDVACTAVTEELRQLPPAPDAGLAALADEASARAQQPVQAFNDLVHGSGRPGDAPEMGPGEANARTKQRAAKLAPGHRAAWQARRDSCRAHLSSAESLERKWSEAEPRLQLLERCVLTLAALAPWNREPARALDAARAARRESHAAVVRLRAALREAEWNLQADHRDLLIPGRQSHVWPTASADLKVPPRYAQPRLTRPGGGS